MRSKRVALATKHVLYFDPLLTYFYFVLGTSIKCSFKRMLVLDTWRSIKDSKSELERWNRVFRALIQLLPDVENFIADDLEKRVTKFVQDW